MWHFDNVLTHEFKQLQLIQLVYVPSNQTSMQWGEFGRIFFSEAFEIHRYPQSSPLLST